MTPKTAQKATTKPVSQMPRTHRQPRPLSESEFIFKNCSALGPCSFFSSSAGQGLSECLHGLHTVVGRGQRPSRGVVRKIALH